MGHEEINDIQLRRLLDVGRSLVSELDLESLLNQVLETAIELTRARYGALGILDREKVSLERFINLGIDEETRRGIGPLPQGRGVLGELIRHPEPLRLSRVGDHPRSYGFPPGHPEMDSFLGVPIKIRKEAFGNIYLTEKEDGQEFDDLDEAVLVVLADWAAVAIDNARTYEESETRRRELERAVQTLEATVALARVGADETDIDSLIELITKRGRALVDSSSLLLLTPGTRMSPVIVAVAGDVSPEICGQTVDTSSFPLGPVLRDGMVHHLRGGQIRLSRSGPIESTSALTVNLGHRGRSQGILIALDSNEREDFNSDDELLFQSFAGSAASSLAAARDVEKDRLRRSIEASEQERRRWAMELHDETLQELGALKVGLESSLGTGDPELMARSLERSAAHLETTIDSLESLIQELRPATLDALGVAAAVETLVERTSTRGGFRASTHLDLAFDRGDAPERLNPQLEATIYRVVQESLNNAVKHAEASSASVSITETGGRITIFVEDDGKGFVPADGFGDRFGLHGMKERVGLVGGDMEIDSAPGHGTRVEVHLPVR